MDGFWPVRGTQLNLNRVQLAGFRMAKMTCCLPGERDSGGGSGGDREETEEGQVCLCPYPGAKHRLLEGFLSSVGGMSQLLLPTIP